LRGVAKITERANETRSKGDDEETLDNLEEPEPSEELELDIANV